MLLCLFLTTPPVVEDEDVATFFPVALTTWGGMSGGNLTALATLWARLMLIRVGLRPPGAMMDGGLENPPLAPPPPSSRPILLRAS